MGYITSNKMVPIIILKILWRETDENHPITLENLGRQLLRVYEPREPYVGKTLGKKIVRVVEEINDFFENMALYEAEKNTLYIERVMLPSPKSVYGRCVGYYLTGRIFSDAELRLLCDSVLFSPGIEQKQAGKLFDKLSKLSCNSFTNYFKSVRYSDVVPRTDNEEVFHNIEVIAQAIDKRAKIMFKYKKRDRVYYVSPYYMVLSQGKYYLLCNLDGKGTMAPYRLDQIKNIHLLDTRETPINALEKFDSSYNNVAKYMKQRPRMSTGDVVHAMLIVHKDYLDVVKIEFEVGSVSCEGDEYYRVNICSTASAICNWVINLPGKVMVENDFESGVIDLICEKSMQHLVYYKRIV